MSVTRRDGQTQARQHDNASGRPYVTERPPTTDGAKAKRLQSIDRFYASSKPGRDKNPPNLATLRVAELGHLFLLLVTAVAAKTMFCRMTIVGVMTPT